MEAEAFRRVHPREYYLRFLSQRVRPDGRGLAKTRKTTITTGTVASAAGSAAVRLGNTAVVAAARLEVGRVESGAEGGVGRLAVNVELGPLCSSQYIPGRVSEDAHVASQFVEGILQSAGYVDMRQLCIVAETAVWTIYLDIYCLDHDGNIHDAALIAAVTVLRDVRIPHAELREDGNVVADYTRTHPLVLGDTPTSLTFAMLDEYVLADPTHEEETLASGSFTLVQTSGGLICGVDKSAGDALPMPTLRECMRRLEKRAGEMEALLEQAAASRSQCT